MNHVATLPCDLSFIAVHVSGCCCFFSDINISQGSVATSDAFEGWLDILLSIYYKFTATFVVERILEIGQYLAKLEPKIHWHIFSGHGV